MAISFNPGNILHGNDGKLWMGGDEILTGISLEAKLTIDTENVNVLGNAGTYSRFNGYSGSGTIKRYKTDSSFIKIMIDYVTSGIAPDLTVIASVEQPQTGKVERIAFKDISFTEVTLANMEAKSLIEEEIPFDFGSFEALETI